MYNLISFHDFHDKMSDSEESSTLNQSYNSSVDESTD